MTVFINPAAAGPGAGTSLDPFKDIPTSLPPEQYRIRRGTTVVAAAGTQAVNFGQSGSAGAEVLLGAYGDENDPPPIIDCAAVSRGVNIGTDIAHIIVEDLRLTNIAGGTSRRGVTNATTGSSSSIQTFITLRRLTIDHVQGDGANDCNAIQLFGADNAVLGSTLEDIATDGLWYRGHRFRAEDNVIRRVSIDGRAAGDCLQCGGASDSGRILRNVLDHSNVDAKQCYIHNTASSGLLFEGNTCVGYPGATFTTVLVSAITGAIIRFNAFLGGANAHVSAAGTNAKVYANLAVNNFGRGIDANAVGVEVYCNTVVGAGLASVYGIRHNNAANTSVLLRNNALIGWDRGISATTGASHGGNAYWQCATNSSGGSSLGGDVTADPRLTAEYLPRAGSPLPGGGIDLGPVRDRLGRQGRKFIGAHGLAPMLLQRS